MVMWETATGKVTLRPPDLDLKKMELKGGGNRSVMSADGKSLVVEMAVSVPPPPEITEDKGGWEGQEYYWCGVDLTTGKLPWRPTRSSRPMHWRSPPTAILSRAACPEKSSFATATRASLLHDLDCHTKYPRPWPYGQLLAFTSDGKRFIATDAGTNIFVWDVTTGKELNKFAGHRGRILSVSISPDNTMFATSSEDSTVLLWHLE